VRGVGARGAAFHLIHDTEPRRASIEWTTTPKADPNVTILDHNELIVKPGCDIGLANFDSGSTGTFRTQDHAKTKLKTDIERLAELQDVFYATKQYALLIIFQGMDAAGKDGAIKHVMTGVNPQGVDVNSFKVPSAAELEHDYLWRTTKVLPPRGRIGIFNRSYYEELVVARVHTSVLEAEDLPPGSIGSRDLWKDRFEDVNAFERHMTRNGTLILKFFLHLSNEEQRERLLKRIDTPEKNWKLSASDVHERTFWNDYQRTYEEMLEHTSSAWAPWYIVPADHKWFTRVAVASVIVTKLEALGLTYPEVSDEQRAHLAALGEQLAHKEDQSQKREPELSSV
jgi:PPK2 family polyphosphate:nucleotide phosphotransferase